MYYKVKRAIIRPRIPHIFEGILVDVSDMSIEAKVFDGKLGNDRVDLYCIRNNAMRCKSTRGGANAQATEMGSARELDD